MSPPSARKGIKAKISSVISQLLMKAMMMAVPMLAMACSKAPARPPVPKAACVASLDKRAHRIPVRFLGSSKKPISWMG